MPQERPTVIIKNNTGANVPVTLFQYGGIPSSINATRTFQYATPPTVFPAAGIVTIQVRSSSTQPFRTYSAPVGARTPQGVVDALNGLNLGTSWYTKEIAGDTYILTENNTLEFGDLTLSDPDQYTLEVQSQLPASVAELIIRVNGTVIHTVTGPFPELRNEFFDIAPGNQVSVYGEVTTLDIPSSFVTMAVVAVIPSGFEFLFFQNIQENQSATYNFTASEDVLGYLVAFERGS